MKTLLAAAILLSSAIPSFATTYKEVMSCVNKELTEQGSSKECPVVPRVTRDILGNSCRPTIDDYIKSEQADGRSVEMVQAIKVSLNDYVSDYVRRNLPEIQRQNFCG